MSLKKCPPAIRRAKLTSMPYIIAKVSQNLRLFLAKSAKPTKANAAAVCPELKECPS